MAEVTAFTAARMKQIEDTNVVDAYISGSNLIFVTNDGTLIDVGPVAGTPGPPGVSPVFLDPGESTAGLPDGTKVCRRYV